VQLLQILKNGSSHHLILDRPEKFNALNRQLLQELLHVLQKLENDPSCRLIVIESSSSEAFSSGVDLEDLAAFKNIEEARDFGLLFDSVMLKLLKCTKPIIAVIDGLAYGGGFALASAADLRIITEKGKISFPAGRLGAVLPPVSTYMLNALVGIGISRDLLLSGRIVMASEAFKLKLVNRLINAADKEKVLQDESANILKNSDTAIKMTKRITNQQLIVEIEKYNLTGAENFAYLAATEEWQKRIRDFLRK
jgi:enoyl-CoA hydratase/carnithine racemase